MRTTVLAIATFFATLTTGVSSIYAQEPVRAELMQPGTMLPAGMKMPNVTTTEGQISLHEAMGKNGLLVMFSCNTCPFVVKNQVTAKQAMEYAAKNGVGVIIVNSNEAQRGKEDSYEAMRKYAKEQGYTMPYVIDVNAQLADMFGANHTPEIYLFNAQNKLVYKGAMNDNPGNPQSATKMYVKDAIDAMVAGKEPNPNVTKSVGCSIKRRTS